MTPAEGVNAEGEQIRGATPDGRIRSRPKQQAFAIPIERVVRREHGELLARMPLDQLRGHDAERAVGRCGKCNQAASGHGVAHPRQTKTGAQFVHVANDRGLHEREPAHVRMLGFLQKISLPMRDAPQDTIEQVESVRVAMTHDPPRAAHEFAGHDDRDRRSRSRDVRSVSRGRCLQAELTRIMLDEPYGSRRGVFDQSCRATSRKAAYPNSTATRPRALSVMARSGITELTIR